MDSIRRTIPRSARRTTRPSGTTGPKTLQRQARHDLSERYIPGFAPSVPNKVDVTPSGAGGLGLGLGLGLDTDSLEPIRSEEAYDRTRSCLSYCHAPQSNVRWLRGVSGREAVAIAGSADGQVDTISFYSVWMEDDELKHVMHRTEPHVGKVTAINVGNDGLVAIGSSTGHVSAFHVDAWENVTPSRIGSLQQIKNRMNTSSTVGTNESVVGVVALGNDRVCAAGEHGSVCLFPVERRASALTTKVEQSFTAWGERFDQVGLDALAVVDESAKQVVGAGMCAVTVWDVRNGSTTARFVHPTKEAATAVTVDPSQPHFVIVGFRNGEVCAWDRRAGDSNVTPVSRSAVHDGPIWDVHVVSCSRPGRLITCGEDGMVLLVDYAMAAARTGGIGGGGGAMGDGWSGSGEFWRANIENGDVQSLIGKSRVSLGVNAVDAHFSSELFAYASDSAQIGFGTLAYAHA